MEMTKGLIRVRLNNISATLKAMLSKDRGGIA
jgi:hypothetical protein